MPSPTALLSAALLVYCAAAAPAQMRRRGGTINPNLGSDDMSAAVATFDGTVRAVSKNQLLLEVGEDKTLTLTLNKKTAFLDGGKVVKASEVKSGAMAAVEVHKVMGEMIAIKVRLRGADSQVQHRK